MAIQVKINWYFVIVLLIASASLIESKRGFSIGRSRKKVSNPNVRRNNNQPSVPDHVPKNQNPSTTNADHKPAQSPVGPPPPYSGLGHNLAPSNGAPPAYSLNQGLPPSYSAATGNSYSNIGRIPPRGSSQPSGFPDATSFHGIGYGHNAYGGPSHTSGLYANNGMGMGGFSGVGTYGSGYGHGSNQFSFGNILTGLASWNVARGFNSYHRPQHIYIHDNREMMHQNPVEPSGDFSHSTQVSQEAVGPVAGPSESSVLSTDSPVSEDMNFVTYHPSLLTYAAHIGYQPDSVHYFSESTGNTYPEVNYIPKSTTDVEEEEEEESTEHSTEIPITTSTEILTDASTEIQIDTSTKMED